MAYQEEQDQFIEPRILSGMIVSTDFLSRLALIWDDRYLDSPDVNLVATWVWDYYERYGEAPGRHVQDIYFEKLRTGELREDRAEGIELMLQRASEDFGREQKFNVDYLLDRARAYFRERRLELHQQDVQELIDEGRTEEAEQLNTEYQSLAAGLKVGLDLGSEESLERIEQAFEDTAQRVVNLPGPAGELMNHHLVRGGFVSFLAPEKRGKTWTMMDLALRALRQKANVAFFQAGDMSEAQQLKRICVYLARRPEEAQMPKDGIVYKPVKDCIFNQTDQCDLDERECDFGLFEDREPHDLRDTLNGVTFDELRDALEEHGGEYHPCTNCKAFADHSWGVPWYKKLYIDGPLETEEAKRHINRFFNKYRNRFKLSTHASATLSPADMRSVLNQWEREDGFVPDLIVCDYADLLAAPGQFREFRHSQNAIWESLRGLAQEKHALVLTATQADAKSYETNQRLGMGNFSEDKRKLAHVTAMFGLNQGGKGRERRLGLLYINQIVVREGEFDPSNGAYVMQALPIGRPFVGSFW